MNYLTQPGTIPHLAIEHLRTLPPGTKLSTAELAEAIGHDKAILAACLRSPRDHGAVCSEQIPGSPAHRWWIPTEQDAKKPEPTPEPIQGPAPARKPRPKPAPKPEPAIKPEPQPEPPKPQPVDLQPQKVVPSELIEPTGLRFGVFDDGSMLIDDGIAVIALDKQEARRLARFISRCLPK